MIIYLHGFNSSSSSSKAQSFQSRLKKTKPSESLLIPDLPLSTQGVICLLEDLMSKNKVKGLIGSSMGGFYACYFANKYNTKGVYINPVVDKHLDGMRDIVGEHKNFNNKNIDSFSLKDYQDLFKYVSPKLKKPSDHFLLAQSGDEVLDQNISFDKFKKCKISYTKGGNHQYNGFEDKIEEIINFLS